MEEKIFVENSAAEEEKYVPKTFELSIKDGIFALLFCVASVMFSSFGLFGGFCGGFTVSFLVIFGVITAYLCTKNVKISAIGVVLGMLSCALSVIFSITSNGSVRFFGFICIVLSTIIWFDSLVRKDKIKSEVSLLASIFAQVFEEMLPNLPVTFTSFFNGKGKFGKNLGRVLIGIALAIPVLIIVVPLLMSSDDAFKGFVEMLFDNVALTLLEFAIGIVIAVMVITYCLTLKKENSKTVEIKGFGGVENAIIISFLSVISICYLTYLFSQLAYFFSAFKGFLPKDYKFTYAEYARKGFFEMCAIAGINLVLILVVFIISKKKNGKVNIASRLFCVFIGLFTLLIITTAISKMVLYIDTYGMTVLRLTTSAFMIFLAVVFIAVMLKLFIKRIRIIYTALITASIILLVLGIGNVNKVAADYNYYAYKNGLLETEVDVYSFYELGDEGVPYLVKLCDEQDLTLREDAREQVKSLITFGDYYETEYEEIKGNLYGFIGRYEVKGKVYDKPSQFSFARNEAYEALDKFIEENPEILYVKNESNYSY
ncbi:MAG: DUF4173 domain-containing protein [Ruminococcaceae bacterium]|nr:DUF4173 domain-containing protein [Oscillospiraceae bacterium]